MSQDCCYPYGHCTREPGCPAGQDPSIAELKNQWYRDPRNEREAHSALGGGTVFNEQLGWELFEPEETDQEPLLTPGAVLLGCGAFLALCVVLAMLALYFWR